jgi:hypothetical protein
MRRGIVLLSLFGSLAFAGAWLLSYLQPLLVERAARELIRIEVQAQVEGKLASLDDSRIAGLAQRALRRANVDIDREKLRADVAAKVAEMLRSDCECRRRLGELVRAAETSRLASLVQGRAQLTALIEARYASVRDSLLREFRIFTASNAIAFVLLGAVTLVRGRARLQLLLPAIVLVGAVLVTGGLYLFNQDWLHTIVFGDYLGLGYAAYLSGLAALLADIAFNRARITSRVCNFIAGLLGSAATALPC